MPRGVFRRSAGLRVWVRLEAPLLRRRKSEEPRLRRGRRSGQGPRYDAWLRWVGCGVGIGIGIGIGVAIAIAIEFALAIGGLTSNARLRSNSKNSIAIAIAIAIATDSDADNDSDPEAEPEPEPDTEAEKKTPGRSYTSRWPGMSERVRFSGP